MAPARRLLSLLLLGLSTRLLVADGDGGKAFLFFNAPRPAYFILTFRSRSCSFPLYMSNSISTFLSLLGLYCLSNFVRANRHSSRVDTLGEWGADRRVAEARVIFPDGLDRVDEDFACVIDFLRGPRASGFPLRLGCDEFRVLYMWRRGAASLFLPPCGFTMSLSFLVQLGLDFGTKPLKIFNGRQYLNVAALYVYVEPSLVFETVFQTSQVRLEVLAFFYQSLTDVVDHLPHRPNIEPLLLKCYAVADRGGRARRPCS
mmetsp:Transcript_4070/g.7502  ORF Transcript_4070/g.7502 Transcript_4070/m.7502 type:complete len:259 (-) Transcript_4070:764-1540(-)